MRTTITIDDAVFKQLKARAVQEETTVSCLIEEAIRLEARLRAEKSARQAFELVTFGKGGRFTRLDVDRVSALIEQDDIGRYGRRGLKRLR